MAAVTPASTSSTRLRVRSSTLPSKVRMVPVMRTCSAMMLARSPPSMVPMVSTTVSAGLVLRLTTVWRAMTACDAATMASTA